jgi:hypothetical protein
MLFDLIAALMPPLNIRFDDPGKARRISTDTKGFTKMLDLKFYRGYL